MAQSANNALFDSYILRSILIERLSNGYARSINQEYKLILDDIIERLQRNEVIDIGNVNKIIKELTARIDPQITLTDDLKELATSEALFVQSTINTVAGITLVDRIPPDSILERIAKAPLYMGSTIMETFTQFDDKLKYDLQAEIRQAVIQGETIPQIKKRIVDRFGVSATQAQTIARTATATLTSNVRQETYNQNLDIFKGWKSIAVLDTRTSDICVAYADLLFDIDYKPIGHNKPFRPTPRHPNCRSIIVPILKSYRELGLPIDEISNLTKASMDGSVPAELSFKDWLKSKDEKVVIELLGRGRAQLFLDGKITLANLIGRNGQPLTLKELKQRYE